MFVRPLGMRIVGQIICVVGDLRESLPLPLVKPTLLIDKIIISEIGKYERANT
jgi:hypothetical protein